MVSCAIGSKEIESRASWVSRHKPGLKDGVPIHVTASPLDTFNHFITEDDFQTMSDETNRYAHQFFEEKPHTLKLNSRFHKWVETTLSEMKVFIAMIVAMGLVVQLDLSEYWKTCDITSTPFVPKCMSRDRFWLITIFFHLANNDDHVRRGLPETFMIMLSYVRFNSDHCVISVKKSTMESYSPTPMRSRKWNTWRKLMWPALKPTSMTA